MTAQACQDGARPIILLDVTSPSGAPGKIDGFRFLWAYYVSGYNPARHCQPCFKGRRVEEFCTRTASAGRTVILDLIDRYPFVYVCGVARGPKRELAGKNLHFPLRYAAGRVEEITTYNGYILRAQNAERVEIPSLPPNWEGKSEEHVRCKNFQFAVASFGYPPQQA
jgi:hypothetical protein